MRPNAASLSYRRNVTASATLITESQPSMFFNTAERSAHIGIRILKKSAYAVSLNEKIPRLLN